MKKITWIFLVATFMVANLSESAYAWPPRSDRQESGESDKEYRQRMARKQLIEQGGLLSALLVF